ncbi:MAG TPA: hypothetical protein VNI83_09050 [Vicinamibacterales bacterium]|nr:hypothetical protein [Vicinamibacterales bacterium]
MQRRYPRARRLNHVAPCEPAFFAILRPMARLYALVIVVEVAVIAGLWALGAWFG